MPSFELINNSIELARELSLELELTTRNPSVAQIKDTENVMNQHLWAVRGDAPITLLAAEAYIDIPTSPEALELLPEYHLEDARIEQATIRGKMDSFRWLGATSVRAFGIHMNEVDIITPHRLHTKTAFLPVEAVA